MQAYIMPRPARNRFPAYEVMAEAQARLDYANDQRRFTPPVPPPARCTVARHAHLDEVEGYALRDRDNRVFFIAGTTVTELYDVDMPRLMLFGPVGVLDATPSQKGA